jgi:hypothetical protein
MNGLYRTGAGQVRIVHGAFDVLFPGAVAALYEQKLAHIDADGNRRCDLGEPMFIDNALINQDITFTFAPDELRVRAAPSGLCDMMNNWPVP